MSTSPLSAYEQKALAEIDRFKNDEPTWVERIAEKIHKPIEAFTSQALDNVAGDALGMKSDKDQARPKPGEAAPEGGG